MIRAELRTTHLELCLDDPDRRNALGNRDYSEMASTLDLAGSLSAPETATYVLIRGNGPTFCSGNRLDLFATEWPQGDQGPVVAFLTALEKCPIPVIATVQGGAVGIGATMLLHCDVVLCSDDAFVKYPFVSLGIAPEGGASMLLEKRMGRLRTMEILLSGRKVHAEEMLSLGLCTSVHAPDEIEQVLRGWQERLGTLDPIAVRETKSLLFRHGRNAIVSRFQEEIDVIDRLIIQKTRTGEGLR